MLSSYNVIGQLTWRRSLLLCYNGQSKDVVNMQTTIVRSGQSSSKWVQSTLHYGHMVSVRYCGLDCNPRVTHALLKYPSFAKIYWWWYILSNNNWVASSFYASNAVDVRSVVITTAFSSSESVLFWSTTR